METVRPELAFENDKLNEKFPFNYIDMWGESVKFCNGNYVLMKVNIEIFHNFVHLLSELLVYWGKQDAMKVYDIELHLWTQNRTQNGLKKIRC